MPPRPDRPTACVDPLDTLLGVKFEAKGAAELYQVDADTLPALRQQMSRRSPVSMAGGTRWYVSWGYGGRCDGSALKVTLEVRYSMPRWIQPAAVDPKVIDGWSGFIDALWCHEYGHTEFGVAVAEQVHAALSELAHTASSCAQLDREGDRVFSEILERELAAEDAYDVSTHHGETMGARLPTD